MKELKAELKAREAKKQRAQDGETIQFYQQVQPAIQDGTEVPGPSTTLD